MIYSGKINPPQKQTNQPSEITKLNNELTDLNKLIKYQSFDLGITAQYPTSWVLNEEDPSIITFSGPEGYIEIHKVESFGGACPPEYEKLEIDGSKFNTCHYIKDNGIETWEQITREFKNMVGSYRGVQIDAYANTPVQSNQKTILKILST